MTADDTRQAAIPRPAPAGPRPTPAPVPRPAPVTAAAPKQRPDPRPMRLALGAGTIAAVSIMAAGLVRFPAASGDTSADALAADALTAETLATARPEVRIQHRTVYVQLKPGQQAPKGATVITGKAPPARVVVTTVPARAATTRATRRVVVVTKTRQSGH